MLECDMSGKNKGGREIRKPKQPKKPKTTEVTTLVARAEGKTPRPSSR
jgi:hypothetical protein